MEPKTLEPRIIDLINEKPLIRTCFGTLTYSTGQLSPCGEVILESQEEFILYKGIDGEKDETNHEIIKKIYFKK